ncbi:MAG: DUF5722 domain-containing protein [Alistipes sp.]|nr:DUF5722 domain-containing protein [Alistipes sp.]
MNYTFMNMKKIKIWIMIAAVLLLPGVLVQAQENNAQSEDYYRTETRTKKGLQEAFSYSGVYEDLGISHTLINVCINELLNGNVPYSYNGRLYYFNYIPDLSTEKVAEFNENDVSVTLVLLLKLDNSSRSYNLVYPGAMGNTEKLYYGWNVYDPQAVETLSALMDFLANAYGKEDCHIDNWVVGNEVNMPNAWNYTGTTNVETNVDIAARSFVIVNNAIKRYNRGARAYISLDHSWTHNDEGRGIAGKTFLDAFAVKINELSEGIDWNIAYHLYAPIMTESNIWDSRHASRYTPQRIDADFISARNLSVFTDYVRENFGENVRIILSEQGFTVYAGQEARQAAALAYTYYAAEFNDMVDATMFRSLRDAPEETKDRFYFGLINGDGTPRQSYNVFKYMDTEEWESYTQSCLDTIGIGLWNELVTYFDGQRFVREPVREIYLDKTDCVLAVGCIDVLKYSVYPEFASTKGIYWESDDESIADIDRNTGEITGNAPGRTIVTAKLDGVDYASCIVVVKDAGESGKNVDAFTNGLYKAATGNEAPENDLLSYRQRLMNHHITAAQVAYEVVSRKAVKERTATDEDYIRLMYEAVLGKKDEEIPAEDLEKYKVCLEAGMARERVFVDLVSSTGFDYRCYDFDVETGSSKDISELRYMNLTVYNRDSDATYFVADTWKVMTGTVIGTEDLKKYVSGLFQSGVTKRDIWLEIYRSDAFTQKTCSDGEFVDMLYRVSKTGESKVKQIWLNMLKSDKITRDELIEIFAGLVV